MEKTESAKDAALERIKAHATNDVPQAAAEAYASGKQQASAVAEDDNVRQMAQRLESVEQAVQNLSTGTRTRPAGPQSMEAPAILARGMKRDTDPVNYGAYIRGQLTGNWKQAEREKEIFNALSTGSSSGDGLVPSIVGSEVILDLLGVSAIGDSLTEVVNLASGAIQVPTEDTAPSAEWVAEGAELSDATPVFGTASIEPHNLAIYLEVTNQLVQDAPQVADRHIRDSMRNKMARAIDTGFLNGTGASNQPTGLLAGSPGYEVDESGNSLTFDMITREAWKIIGAGGMRENIRVIAHPDAFTYLDSLREDSSSGGYLQASAPVEPVRVASDKVPVASATPDTSQVLIGDFRQGATMYNFGPMMLAVDPSAAFRKNSIAFRITARLDFLVKHSDLVTRLDTVNLG